MRLDNIPRFSRCAFPEQGKQRTVPSDPLRHFQAGQKGDRPWKTPVTAGGAPDQTGRSEQDPDHGIDSSDIFSHQLILLSRGCGIMFNEPA